MESQGSEWWQPKEGERKTRRRLVEGGDEVCWFKEAEAWFDVPHRQPKIFDRCTNPRCKSLRLPSPLWERLIFQSRHKDTVFTQRWWSSPSFFPSTKTFLTSDHKLAHCERLGSSLSADYKYIQASVLSSQTCNIIGRCWLSEQHFFLFFFDWFSNGFGGLK